MTTNSKSPDDGTIPTEPEALEPEAAGDGGGASESMTRAGYVTLLGQANAGKSTLMNAMLGQALSIVTARPQTTWRRVTGLLSRGGAQFIFLDTPGLLEPRDLLQRSLLAQALEALREADVLVVVLDPVERGRPELRERIREAVQKSAAPVVLVLNKMDAATEEAMEREEAWARDVLKARVHRVSALTGEGVAELLDTLEALLPQGPFLYPADDVATDPVRFFVAERVRETVMERYRDEIPYSVFAQVEEYREDGRKTYIQVTLYVERASQKGILIGNKGEAIRALGREAREKIEHFLGEEVYLDLWVKVLPGWRRKKAHLRRLGFSVPEDDVTP
ncbi:MAG: GTPase Era [Gemmatimonadales bacterium]|nr:MAG: GTPase Era [Gemmatimonadales bacterium]